MQIIKRSYLQYSWPFYNYYFWNFINRYQKGQSFTWYLCGFAIFALYQYWSLFVEWIIKILFFTDIWYPLCERLLRPEYNIFKKWVMKLKLSNLRMPEHILNLHVYVCMSQFKKAISMWDTLLFLFFAESIFLFKLLMACWAFRFIFRLC